MMKVKIKGRGKERKVIANGEVVAIIHQKGMKAINALLFATGQADTPAAMKETLANQWTGFTPAGESLGSRHTTQAWKEWATTLEETS